jgi:HD-GYP domain-containing protein (c-di-GMP phosphodiesterase class II)
VRDIPLGSRIIAIADTFDAMSSDRPYRKAIPYKRCIEEIHSQEGKQFDPEWVDIFLDMAATGSL